jgi:endonuclease/exonuclease/phosphatase (EEP) superfamily protein YafD
VSSESIRRGLAKRVRVLLYLTCAVSLLGWIPGEFVYFELSTHFRPHYVALLLGGCLWFCALRQFRHALLLLLCLLPNAASVLPLYLPEEPAPGEGVTPLRLLLANVHSSNTQHERVLDLIRGADADVVILLEVNARWLDALQPIEADYPQRLKDGREDNFGIALYSRLPFDDLELWLLGAARVPTLVGTLLHAGEPVTIIATHPVPPIGSEMFDLRNEQLRSVAALAKSMPRCVVIGDLNTTPWSPFFGQLERDSGLRNVRRGFGILATWPVGIGLLGIPLDHCLVSPSIHVADVRLGQEIGADHLPLLVDLHLP